MMMMMMMTVIVQFTDNDDVYHRLSRKSSHGATLLAIMELHKGFHLCFCIVYSLVGHNHHPYHHHHHHCYEDSLHCHKHSHQQRKDTVDIALAGQDHHYMKTSILSKISTIMIITTGDVLYILVGQEGESACVIEGVETREGLCSQMVSGIVL